MKFSGSIILIIISVFLFGCEKTENSVSTTENSFINSTNLDSSLAFESLSISKLIDGTIGGSIDFDTTYVDYNGKSVSISFNLSFDPNSFLGTKLITVTPNLALGSIQFSPAMKFNKSVKLNLSYQGIDFEKLGFDSNCKVDFVYVNESGKIEYILKDDVKINFKKKNFQPKSTTSSFFQIRIH